MYRKLFIIILIFLSKNSLAQSQINYTTQAFYFTDTSFGQFSLLLNHLKEKQVIGIGEASHGIQEFYTTKYAMVKQLILHEQFKTLAFEMEENIAEKLNQFTSGNTEELSSTLKNYGLYNAEELGKLLTWIKQYNSTQLEKANKISIVGFDREEYWADPFSRDSLMAENFIKKYNQNKTIIWSHNSHLVKSNTWDVTNSGVKSMGNYLFKHFKDEYYVVALDAYSGRLNTIENGSIASFDFKLPKKLLPVQHENYILIYYNKENPLPYNLTNLSSNLEGNPQIFPTKMGLDIDALIFIKETTASKVFK